MFKKGQLLRGSITERHVVVIAWPVVEFAEGQRTRVTLVTPNYWRLVGNNYKEKPRD